MMSKKEVSLIAQNIKDDIKVYSYWTKINMSKLISNLSQVRDADAPDAFLVLDNVVYLIEHFKLSAYRTNKKGDSLQRAFNTPGNHDLKPPKLDDLVKNFISIFSSHAKKFNQYFQKAKEKYPGKPYKLILLIEDTSQYILSSLNDDSISILNIDTINSILYNHPQVDGVIVKHSSVRDSFYVLADKQGLKKIKTYPSDAFDFPAYINSLSNQELLKMRNFLCSILEKAECVDSFSVEKFNTIDEYNFFNKKNS